MTDPEQPQYDGFMLTFRNVTKYYGAQLVLKDVSFSVGRAARLGVVGPNGIGKSTLLRIAAGLESPDQGEVERDPHVKIGYAPQELSEVERRLDVLTFLQRRSGVLGVEEEVLASYETAQSPLHVADIGQSSLRRSGGFDAQRILGQDGFKQRVTKIFDSWTLSSTLLTQPLGSLSGGQQAKITLCSLVLARFDLLLLDEPTNNLDFFGLGELESLCGSTRAAVVVISHDREFLDRTVTRILELQAGLHRAAQYAGDYSAFVVQRNHLRDEQRKRYQKQVRERARLEESARRRREWMRRGGGSESHDRDKLARGAARDRATAGGSGLRSIEKRIEKLSKVEKPWEEWDLHLDLTALRRSGDLVLRLERAEVERGRFVLGPINYELRWQQRVGIVGENGSGKTSLVELVAGSLPPSRGRRRLGSGVVVGHFEQVRTAYDTDEPLLRVFMRRAEMSEEASRSQLAKFGLSAEDIVRSAKGLSPGEKSRAILAELMARSANLLLLDEPTNHLDLEAIEELEKALQSFNGTLVVVSHDRRFLRNIRLDEVWEMNNGQLGRAGPAAAITSLTVGRPDPMLS